jgi:hypothetical protein
MANERTIIKKDLDLIPPLAGQSNAVPNILSITKVKIENDNNKSEAIKLLIERIGEVKYHLSHLFTLITTNAPIEEIESNWLVIGITDHEGKINLEKQLEREEEFELYIKE